MMDRAAARAVSSYLFNNDKFGEVVLAISRWDRPTFTAQEIAREVGINHDLIKKVLNRLESLDLVKTRDRIGGVRGPLPYEVQENPVWFRLVALVKAAVGESN